MSRSIFTALSRLVIDETEVPENTCWLNRSGVRNHKLYRRIYAYLFGAIPDGLDLDHLCLTPACCNPWHLEPVPHRVNSRRANVGENNRSKTHCRNGHELTPDNTYTYERRGWLERQCKVCHKAASLRHKRKKRASEEDEEG